LFGTDNTNLEIKSYFTFEYTKFIKRRKIVKDFKWLIKENIPCWYELSWKGEKPAIILRIHRDFIKAVPSITPEHSIVKALMGQFKFQNFCGNFEGNFGFDEGAFENLGGVKNGFFEYLVPIPKIKVETGKPCKECKGSGKDPYNQKYGLEDRECIHCNGSGKEYFYNWQLANAVSAGLSIFFRISHYHEKETSTSLPQLMIVDTIIDHGMHGGSLGGEFSIPLTKYLASLYQGRDTAILEISQATKTAYATIFGDVKRCNDYYFRAYVGSESGGLVADCPGDACGIHPSDWHREKERGYQFSCHNVDTVAQQITLLAGLAALHDKARRGIKSY